MFLHLNYTTEIMGGGSGGPSPPLPRPPPPHPLTTTRKLPMAALQVLFKHIESVLVNLGPVLLWAFKGRQDVAARTVFNGSEFKFKFK